MRGASLDAIAVEAGCSRATLYRIAPGGKRALLEQVTTAEVARLFDAVAAALDGADTLGEALIAAISTAGTFLADSGALRTVIAREPELLLSSLAFDRLDPLLDASGATLGPLLERFVDRRTAIELIEWCARLVLSFTFEPTPQVDLLRRDDVTRLVRRHVLPGAAYATAGQLSDTQP